MNTQERDQLSHFLQQLAEVKLVQKDSDAEVMIQQAVVRQPDAAYLLVQRSMLLEQALNNAKQQIADLQAQMHSARPQSAGGFLNNDPWAQPAPTAGVPGAGNYQVPRYAAPAPAPVAAGGGFLGGGSSFLGNVATTAAGVVAGSFLFQGIENLLGHHSSAGGNQMPMAGGESVTEYTTVNNYYGDDAGQSDFQQASYDDAPSDNDFDDDSFQDAGDSDSGWV